jgi:hypothetical protein
MPMGRSRPPRTFKKLRVYLTNSQKNSLAAPSPTFPLRHIPARKRVNSPEKLTKILCSHSFQRTISEKRDHGYNKCIEEMR